MAHSRVNTRQFLGLNEALTLLRSIVDPVDAPPQTIGLMDAANRIVADTIVTPMNVPPFAASAMDGYAVCSSDPIFAGAPPFVLPVQGESRAGTPLREQPRADHAVRIFTGAVIPPRCDAVVIQEDVTTTDAGVVLQTRPLQGACVRPAGHDVRAGAVIAQRGTRLGPFDLAWFSACGLQRVPVYPRIRLALFSTGDELRDAGQPLGTGQIYDANRFVLTQLLRGMPVSVDDLGIVADDKAMIEATLRTAANTHDVVVTSGGVSVGDADYVREIVARLGRIEFWKIAIKPGKPLAYGRIDHCHFFGLPGNPVSTIVTFLMLVKPILAHLAGAAAEPTLMVPAELEVDVAHERGRVEYQRGISTNNGSDVVVRPTSDQSSNRLESFRGANCLIEIPRESGNLRRGDRVEVLPLTGLLG